MKYSGNYGIVWGWIIVSYRECYIVNKLLNKRQTHNQNCSTYQIWGSGACCRYNIVLFSIYILYNLYYGDISIGILWHY